MKLTVSFTLPRDLGGGGVSGVEAGGGSPNAGNPGQNSCSTEVLPRVPNGGVAGTRGRNIRLTVRVRSRQEVREVEAAEEVPRERRAEVWARWLAEGRYRSGAEIARACGVSRETVSAALRGGGSRGARADHRDPGVVVPHRTSGLRQGS